MAREQLKLVANVHFGPFAKIQKKNIFQKAKMEQNFRDKNILLDSDKS